MQLVVGYIPEHFSAPMMLAQRHHLFEGVEVEFKPYPSGSGHLIQSLGDGSIDVAVGLTEAFVRSIASGATGFGVVGTYVQSPLQWAISVGAKSQISSVDQLDGATCGVSRMGSGSDVMSRVLHADRGFKVPFKYSVLNDFKRLRDGVNSGEADFFMWEHFTSKRYYDSGEIKRVGDIYTPWPSWVIVSATSVPDSAVRAFVNGVNAGISYFNEHNEEALEWIWTNLDYSEADTRAWRKTVVFSKDAGHADQAMIDKTVRTLQMAAGLSDGAITLNYLYN